MVEIATAGPGDVVESLVTSAVVESEAQADLFPLAAGTVTAVRRDEGDAVRKGELLATLDNITLDATADRALAELARAEAELGDLERLHAQGAISDKDLADARHALSTARTSAHEASRTQDYTRITAPFAGVVAVREVRVGEYVSSARRAFQVVDLDRLRVVASLPERDVERVRTGQRARLASSYDESQTTGGTVERVSPVIDPTSGTFRVTIALDPDQEVLRPGQFVSVHVVVDSHADTLVVPREAVVWEDGDPIVYRMIERPEEEEDEALVDAEEGEGEGKLFGLELGKLFGKEAKAEEGEDEEAEEALYDLVSERIPVELGLVDDAHAEILGGLLPGDQVIVVGQTNLRDGAPVLTPEQKAEVDAVAEAREQERAAEKSEEEE